MKTVFALIDANNFFVSCERIFRPDLINKPVIVRSSNDGCVVARSNEAKALGIPMGAPVFKIRPLLQANHVVEFSGSFDLYGDISRRLLEVLCQFCPRIEAYSVDESFLDLSHVPIEDYEGWGRAVRNAVQRTIGIPVSVGIAQTKTLAKLASERAKKAPEVDGVLSLVDGDAWTMNEALLRTPLKDVWGVGWRLAPRLQAEGIHTAMDLKELAPRRAQQLMGIHGRQLVAELNGTCCHPLETEGRSHQSIARTRTLGHDTHDFAALESALMTLGGKACMRLRSEGLLTRRAAFFLTTSKHKPGYRRWFEEVQFDMPSSDTGRIVRKLVDRFAGTFLLDQAYHRVGVMLYDFVPERVVQTDLLGYVNLDTHILSMQRMAALDAINARFGAGKLRFAAEKLSEAWRPKQEARSPRYTTNWSELPEATIN